MTTDGANGSASPLLIWLFGPIEVRRDGELLPPLRTRKGLWLLALLTLHHGRLLDREWLAGTLWPDSPESQALYNLRRSLSDLRRALGAQTHRLQAPSPHSLLLDLTGADVDVVAFDEAIARRDEPALETAVSLYQGPLLQGCGEEWAVQERERREQSYLAALEELATRATARADHGAAARFLRQATAADPCREPAHRALMTALAAGGDTAAALLVYRELRRHLHQEANSEPSQETRALFERLRSEVRRRAPRNGSKPETPGLQAPDALPHSDLEPQTPPLGNLPQALSAFVGRERELLEVGACLDSSRLVTLTGIGGIGKTRLALRVAGQRPGEYADGVWFVDLAALADPALVPQAVAHALRVPETSGAPLTETLQEALGGRQLLLVLDNCEHLVDACARLAHALLSCCPHLRLLATSRQPLGLTGEVAWPLAPLSLPKPVAADLPIGGAELVAADLPIGGAAGRKPGRYMRQEQEGWTPNTLLASEAVRLFVERAGDAAPEFRLTECNAAATVQICRRLDGIPLAIELAAARLRALSIQQLAARLDDRFRLLTGGSRAALPRQQTLRATLDWSYDLLSEPERTLLRRLSVFTGGLTLEAAEAVCSDSGFWISDCGMGSNPSAIQNPKSKIQNEEVLDLLTQLVDRSLVGVQRREGAARYGLLETTREYARERLREVGEEEERRAKHAQFFLALAERAEPELRGAAQAEWLLRLEEEHDNCRAALDYCLAVGAVEQGLRLGGALGWFWWMRGYFSEGRERLQALLVQSGYEIEAAEPDRQIRVARPAEDAGHPERHQERVRLAQAKALNAAGGLADDQGDFEAARALCEESLALCRELGDRPGAAAALNGLGGLARHALDFPAARALYAESLALWQAVGDRWWIAAVLTNLGRVAIAEGEYATARPLIESALRIQRELHDQRVIARSLTQLGRIAARQGDDESAHTLHSESLSIVRKLGAKQAIEEALCEIGRVATERGDHPAALAYYEERLVIARELGNAWGVAGSLYNLGLLARDRGDSRQAEALWSESLAIFQGLGDQQRITQCLEGLASLAAPPGQEEPGQD